MTEIMRLSPKYWLALKESNLKHLFPYDLPWARHGRHGGGQHGPAPKETASHLAVIVGVLVGVVSVGADDNGFSVMCSSCENSVHAVDRDIEEENVLHFRLSFPSLTPSQGNLGNIISPG